MWTLVEAPLIASTMAAPSSPGSTVIETPVLGASGAAAGRGPPVPAPVAPDGGALWSAGQEEHGDGREGERAHAVL